MTGSVNSILARKVDHRLSEIDRELGTALPEIADMLIREKRRLMGEIQALGSPRWKGFNSPRSHTPTENS